jgi:hypothetical protein
MSINIHVDCDPLWVCASEYGLKPDYMNTIIYERSLPALVEMLENRNLRATFFIIGRDLELPACRLFCERLLRSGHQLGNHTYSHFQDIHNFPAEALRDELLRCHEAIKQYLGYSCRGARMPGYYFDHSVAEALASLGYAYDSSVLPGLGVYMMALFYRLFNQTGRNKRFGRAWHILARHSPHRIDTPGTSGFIWELPLGVCPLTLLPVHSTFLFQWGIQYLRLALFLAKARRLSPFVYLFHAIDLLPADCAGELADRISTLSFPIDQRRAAVSTALDCLSREHVILTEDWIALRDPRPPCSQ